MLIMTEETPNPAVLKFLPGRPVMGESEARDFTDAAAAAAASPLAERLFLIEGVNAVFLGNDFISVTKAEEKPWDQMKPPVLGAIMEHFTAGRPVLRDDVEEASADTGVPQMQVRAEDVELVEEIKALLDEHVRPAVARDGGDIVFAGFDSGTVYLYLKGACAGCPSSTLTLKAGIENMLCHYIPEVERVEAL